MLSFRELCDTKLSGFLSFDSTATSLNQKKVKIRKSGSEFMWHQSILFLTLPENLSVTANDT